MEIVRTNIAAGEITPGMVFYFGKNKNWRLPRGEIRKPNMRWRVLEYDPEKETLLAIAAENLEERSYHRAGANGGFWEDSYLRYWLNNGFYNHWFFPEESRALAEQAVPNPGNPRYQMPEKPATKEYVTLLSLPEAEYYLNANIIRGKSATWLRTPGEDSWSAAKIGEDGKIDERGDIVSSLWDVRPVILLNLRNELFRPFVFTESPSGGPGYRPASPYSYAIAGDSFAHLYSLWINKEKEEEIVPASEYFMPAAKIPDLGLDSRGEKIYRYNGMTVKIRFSPDAKFICEWENRSAKTLPEPGEKSREGKKPEENYRDYLLAAADFAAAKKAAEVIKKSRMAALKRDFLLGNVYAPDIWKTEWLSNPICRRLAEGLVWSQNGTTFTVSEDGLLDPSGEAYSLTEEGVVPAHPAEMSPESLLSWRKWFRAEKRKQLFAQLEERAVDPAFIFPDRYRGFLLPGGIRKELADSGIHAAYKSFRGEEYTEIVKITFDAFNRTVNRMINRLDRLTIFGRILSDDPKAAEAMGIFSRKERAAFEDLAEANGCFAVRAAILNWRHETEEDADPMEDFLL